VHKSFYVSGFLFEPKSQQILLYQPNTKNETPSLWSTIGGISRGKENALSTFKRVAQENLKIKLNLDKIYPVYDYFNNKLSKTNYVFYAEVENVKNFRPPHGGNFSWFTFKQTSKLPFSKETKNDIIVAERVIKAHAREKAARLAKSPRCQ
jgi:hypothetical protein